MKRIEESEIPNTAKLITHSGESEFPEYNSDGHATGEVCRYYIEEGREYGALADYSVLVRMLTPEEKTICGARWGN